MRDATAVCVMQPTSQSHATAGGEGGEKGGGGVGERADDLNKYECLGFKVWGLGFGV